MKILVTVFILVAALGFYALAQEKAAAAPTTTLTAPALVPPTAPAAPTTTLQAIVKAPTTTTLPTIVKPIVTTTAAPTTIVKAAPTTTVVPPATATTTLPAAVPASKYIPDPRFDEVWRGVIWRETCKNLGDGKVTGGKPQGNPAGYNRVEDACGIAQIRPICLADVNHVQDIRFTYADRWDVEKSRQIMDLYLPIYLGIYERDLGRAELEKRWVEICCRIWNGGPKGPKKHDTLEYWLPIKEYLATPAKKGWW